MREFIDIFINELSFQGQAKTLEDADKVMEYLAYSVKNLHPIHRGRIEHRPILVSEDLKNKNITESITVKEWMKNHLGNMTNSMQFILHVLFKGPFIERFIDDNIPYHECRIGELPVTSTSISAAALIQPSVLVSLKDNDGYTDRNIPVQCTSEVGEYETKLVGNVVIPLHASEELLNRIENWRELWDYRKELFGNLSFCDKITDYLFDLPLDIIESVKDHLRKMNEKCAEFMDDDEEKPRPRWDEMAFELKYESKTARKKTKMIFITPDGNPVKFLHHARISDYRIYFEFPEYKTDKFYIGIIADKKYIKGYTGER